MNANHKINEVNQSTDPHASSLPISFLVATYGAT